MMKHIRFILLAVSLLLVAQSCVLYETPSVGQVDFPLRNGLIVPIGGTIEEMTPAQTWIAVETQQKIVALDLSTLKVLWTKDFAAVPSPFAESMQTVGDRLFAASPDRVIIVNRDGGTTQLNLQLKGSVLRLVAAYPDLVYIVGGGNWDFQVYDLTHNTLLWATEVGRGGGANAYYDASRNAVYVTGNSIQAFDNTSGRLLWSLPQGGSVSTFEQDTIYSYEAVGTRRQQVIAVSVANQQVIWRSKEFNFPIALGANRLKVIGNTLFLCGGDLIALDKSNGQQIWDVNVGETFYTCPVEYKGALYEMDGTSHTVFTIRLDDGSIIGHVRFPPTGLLDRVSVDTLSAVYGLNDGILFSTRDSVVKYTDR